MTHDPTAVVAEALDRRDSGRKGPAHNCTARCPAHEDRSPSLKVSTGADGRALVHCYAGCSAEDVVRALGLTWADMFPDGHRHAGRRRTVKAPPVATGDPLVEVLAALSCIGVSWRNTADARMFVADRCPGCDERRLGALWVTSIEKRVSLCCWNRCEAETILATISHEMVATREAVA